MFNQAQTVVANNAPTPEKTNVQRVNDKERRQSSTRILTALSGKQKEPNRGQGTDRRPTSPRPHMTGPVKEAANMFSQIDEGVKNKISSHEAGEILDAHGGRDADFHALPSSHVEGLLSHAKRVGYHKSKYANGSRARMFHQFLKKHASKMSEETVVETGMFFEGENVDEAMRSEYGANLALRQNAPAKHKPGHYLVKNGSPIHAEPHKSASDALAAYKGMSNNTGVSIKHIKENGETVPGVVKSLSELQVSLREGSEEHEKLKDHTKNPYHATLVGHGFVHQSTTHKQNPFSKHPKNDYTEHHYTHPLHGKSHVTITQDHSGEKKNHHFVHRHEQSNGIMAPATGDNKEQLHRSLSREYGVPKGMKAPKVMSWEKHDPPHYKMNEDAPAMSSGGPGDPGKVQNATDNYASQLNKRKKHLLNILRRKKKSIDETVLCGHVPPEVTNITVGVVSPEELKKNKELAKLPKKVGPGGTDN